MRAGSPVWPSWHLSPRAGESVPDPRPIRHARRPLRAPIGVEVEELPSRGYLPPRWYQRVWSVLAMSGLAIWVGAVVATLIGFGTATLVIRVTEMLKK